MQHLSSLSKDRNQHYRNMIENMESRVLETVGFNLDLELPYPSIEGFCERHASAVSKEGLFQTAFKFCNDTFRLPLCLYFHPKVIAAACILMAAQWRKKSGLDPGIQSKIQGHEWFKWIDSAIESDQIAQIIKLMSSMYNPVTPIAPVASVPSNQQ